MISLVYDHAASMENDIRYVFHEGPCLFSGG